MTRKVLEFPRRWNPPPSPVDEVLQALEGNRREMRQRWRRERRRPGRKSRRLVLTVGAPPHDEQARLIWALGAALLSTAEAAFDVSVSLHGNADKVLRKYVRLTRKIARTFDAAERDARGRR